MTKVDITLPRKNYDLVINQQFSDGITGIYGPSGSGKTSLLHTMSGLAKPTSGKIVIGNRVLFSHTDKIDVPVEKRNIGYVFQEGRLFPHMDIEKNLIYGNHKIKENFIKHEEVVELLNLGHILKSKPSQVSGGERQRTALGRSLLSSPDILLLDEPFSAVDTRLRSQIIPFIIKIQQKINIPILVVSHDLPDLLKLTDVLCILKDGKCLGHGAYYSLLKNKSISEMIGSDSLVNAINMRIKQIDPEHSMTTLVWQNDGKQVEIKCEKSKSGYKVGQELKIFISADDIALSTEKLTNVTIQNQLQGVVTDIIERDGTLLYIVDIGFRLIAEITHQSKKQMNISTGSNIWCLFKSVAIDVAG